MLLLHFVCVMGDYASHISRIYVSYFMDQKAYINFNPVNDLKVNDSVMKNEICLSNSLYMLRGSLNVYIYYK